MTERRPGQAFAQGSLRAALRERTRSALRSGALRPIETEEHYVEEGGVRFLARVVQALKRKDEDRRLQREEANRSGERRNPFLPYEPELFVADVSPTHVALLNKFNVIDEHLLLVTRDYEYQERLLTLADFAALRACLAEYGSLGFYNGGEVAGASQPHKHLQLVPLPLAAEGPPIPTAPLLYSGGLPFAHALLHFDGGLDLDAPETTELLSSAYRVGLEQAGVGTELRDGAEHHAAPYNLLVTRDWLLVVPRTCEHAAGVSINGLGFAGSLFLRDGERLRAVCERGPLAVLRAVTRPKG